MTRALIPTLLVLFTVGCGVDAAVRDLPDDAPVQDIRVDESVPDGLVPEDVPEDVPPAPPLFKRGRVIPPDSLACVEPDTGADTLSCNHHGSSVAVEEDGTVLVVWYHGKHEKSKDSRIVWSRRLPGGDFGPAVVLFDAPGLAEGNPAIRVHEDGSLFLFFVTILGESWNDAEIRLTHSEDRGETWGDVQVLRSTWGWMVRNHPLRLSNGELLLPLYDETTYTPAFMISGDDYAASWQEIDFSQDPLGFLDHMSQIQPSVIERDDGTLFALSRNTTNAHAQGFEMTSPDFGRTWTKGEKSAVPNAGDGMEMVRLASGRVALAFSNSHGPRYPTAVALSDDEGRSWFAVADLDPPCSPGESCSHGYNSIAQDPTDHSIWITYTDGRHTIGWVHTNEAWIQEQGSAFVTVEDEAR